MGWSSSIELGMAAPQNSRERMPARPEDIAGLVDAIADTARTTARSAAPKAGIDEEEYRDPRRKSPKSWKHDRITAEEEAPVLAPARGDAVDP